MFLTAVDVIENGVSPRTWLDKPCSGRTRSMAEMLPWVNTMVVDALTPGAHTPRIVWDEITYSFPNFNGATVEVWNG